MIRFTSPHIPAVFFLTLFFLELHDKKKKRRFESYLLGKDVKNNQEEGN